MNTGSAIALALRMTFTRPVYVAIAVAVGVLFWIIFNMFDQLLFFSPMLAFYIPADAAFGFVVSTVTAMLLGIVAGLNAFALRYLRAGKKFGGSLLSGTSLATFSSACVGCSSLGFTLASTLGGAGLAATTVISLYQTPLRLASLGILVWALISTSKKVSGALGI